MEPLASADLDSWLGRLPAWQAEQVLWLRALVQRAASGATETLLWGSLSYHRPAVGGRVKGAVCMITPKRGCLHLAFIHGAALPDPHRLLRGSGKAKRHVELTAISVPAESPLTELILAALAYVPEA